MKDFRLCDSEYRFMLLVWETAPVRSGELVRFNTAKKRTIAIEVGMQNAGLATVLAARFFAAQPLAVLPCAISCAWHSISGTILSGLFLKWELRHAPATGKEQPAEAPATDDHPTP